jgi:hypothetical protein
MQGAVIHEMLVRSANQAEVVLLAVLFLLVMILSTCYEHKYKVSYLGDNR